MQDDKKNEQKISIFKHKILNLFKNYIKRPSGETTSK